MTAKEREDKLFAAHFKFEEFNKNFAKRNSKSRHIRDVAQRAFTTAQQIDRDCEFFGTVDLFVEFINLAERLINEAMETTK